MPAGLSVRGVRTPLERRTRQQFRPASRRCPPSTASTAKRSRSPPRRKTNSPASTPNSDGRIAAFGPILLRSEAASSSKIENLTASVRSILTVELGAKTSRTALDIVANTSAMSAALDMADLLDADAILAMHRVLMARQAVRVGGEFRSEPVWIGTSSRSPVGADFVAPRAERVPDSHPEYPKATKVGDISSTSVAFGFIG